MVWLPHPFFDRLPSAQRARGLQDVFDRLIEGASERTTPAQGPLLDVWTSAAGLVVRAALPGVAAEDLDVQVHRNVLTLSGKRHPEEPAEGEEVLLAERWSGEFSRSLQLPFSVEPEAVEATFRDGLLELRLARPTSDQPRRIAVQTA